jgi:hypothetical protein
MSLNRSVFSDNYKNTILDPVLNLAPGSHIPFICAECGMRFHAYKAKLIHQKHYCVNGLKDAATEREIARLKNMEFTGKYIPPVLPIANEYKGTGFTYDYKKTLRKYDYLKNPNNTKKIDYDDIDEYAREVYTPTLDSHRVKIPRNYLNKN